MKKVLTAATVLLFWASMALAQTATPAASSPTPSAKATPGTETTEQVVVTSQELDISREAIVPSLGATRLSQHRGSRHSYQKWRAISAGRSLSVCRQFRHHQGEP